MGAFEAAFFITIAFFAYVEFQKRKHLKQQPQRKHLKQLPLKKQGQKPGQKKGKLR